MNQKSRDLSAEEVAQMMGVADGIRAKDDEQLREDAILWLKWQTGEGPTSDLPDHIGASTEGEVAAYLLGILEQVARGEEKKRPSPDLVGLVQEAFIQNQKAASQMEGMAGYDTPPTRLALSQAISTSVLAHAVATQLEKEKEEEKGASWLSFGEVDDILGLVEDGLKNDGNLALRRSLNEIKKLCLGVTDQDIAETTTTIEDKP